MKISELTGGCLFRRMRRGAIVSVVRASRAMRARFVVAILSLALIYAFTCSATCANCLGSGATESHECGHAAGGAAGRARQHAPGKPDCFGHHRFGFDVMQSDGLSRFELSTAGHASQLVDGGVRAEVVNMGVSFFSDLAPPRDVAIFPQQHNPILRI